MGLFDDLYGTPEVAPQLAKPKQKPYVPLQQVMPNTPSNAQSLELVPSQPPAGLTPKARNEFIANEANRIAAEKIKKHKKPGQHRRRRSRWRTRAPWPGTRRS